jgi:hypothetical protein
MSRLSERYKNEVLGELQAELGIGNRNAVPRLDKIVINIGVGEAIQNAKLLDSARAELAQITGQAPVVSRAKKSISAFKLRKGAAIACYVTLRRPGKLHPRPPGPARLPGDRLHEGGQVAGHEHHHRDVGSDRQGIVRPAQEAGHAVPGIVIKEGHHVDDFSVRQIHQEAEIRHPDAPPLPHLRTLARLLPEIRYVPAVLPRARPQGRDSRRGQGVLVRAGKGYEP